MYNTVKKGNLDGLAEGENINGTTEGMVTEVPEIEIEWDTLQMREAKVRQKKNGSPFLHPS